MQHGTSGVGSRQASQSPIGLAFSTFRGEPRIAQQLLQDGRRMDCRAAVLPIVTRGQVCAVVIAYAGLQARSCPVPYAMPYLPVRADAGFAMCCIVSMQDVAVKVADDDFRHTSQGLFVEVLKCWPKDGGGSTGYRTTRHPCAPPFASATLGAESGTRRCSRSTSRASLNPTTLGWPGCWPLATLKYYVYTWWARCSPSHKGHFGRVESESKDRAPAAQR